MKKFQKMRVLIDLIVGKVNINLNNLKNYKTENLEIEKFFNFCQMDIEIIEKAQMLGLDISENAKYALNRIRRKNC